MDFVDLHSHILPGVDDGAPDIATSIAMVRGLMDIGFSTICATPHQKTGQYLPTLEAINQAHSSVLRQLEVEGVVVTIPLAAENMWDGTLYERMEADAIPSYQGSSAFLLEFVPSQLPLGLFERLFDLRCKGKLPVIAHPERYSPLWKSPELVERLSSDCAMVVDLPNLSGDKGRKQAKYARQMVMNGHAQAAASDVHTLADVKSTKKGIDWIRKKLGEAAVTRLLTTNPLKILEGRHPDG